MTELEKKFVFEKRPLFADIIKKYGDSSFLEYLENSLQKNPPTIDPTRKQEFLTHFERFLREWINNKDEEQKIIESFSQSWIASTADHHGIPWHPFFAGAHFAHTQYMYDRGISHAVVFSASGVSLGNSSLPRSIGFHNESGNLEYEHFFPASMRNNPVYGTSISPISTSIIPMVQEALHTPYVKNSKNFSMQVTRLTYELWNNVPENVFARLAYIPLEELVVDILLHTENTHPLWQLVTTHAEKYLRAVEGIQSAHEHDLSHGSMIFWRRTADGLREALTVENKKITAHDSWSIECSPESIKEALENGSIFPTYALCLFIVSGYFGITCMGGFSQVGYLPKIHGAYANLAADCELPKLQTNPPSIFCEDLVVTKTNNGNAATLIDIMREKPYEKIIETLINQPFQSLIEPIIPELYKILAE